MNAWLFSISKAVGEQHDQTPLSNPKVIRHLGGRFSIQSLLHDLKVFRHLEWCASLGLDLVNADTLGVLDQGKTLGEVDIENSLEMKKLVTFLNSPRSSALTSSVMMRDTQALPVKGNSHCLRILGLPFLSVCSIVTTTLVA